jgi:hypothetical protein
MRTANWSRRRGWRATVVAALVATVSLSACGGGDARYAGNGVSFVYPKGWHTVIAPASSPAPDGRGSTSRVGLGLDASDLVVLVTNELPAAVTADSFGKTRDALVNSLTQGAKQKGATVTGPSQTTLAGMAGFSLTISNLPISGTTVDSRVVVVLNGSTEYFLNCQATAAHSSEIATGCDRILGSFGTT